MTNKKTATKERIEKAAFKLYRSQGLSKVSLSDIARAAKVTPQVLRYHYLTENDLVVALVQSATNSLRDFSRIYVDSKKDKSAKGRMRTYLKAPFEWVKENPEIFQMWVFMLHLSETDETVKQYFQESRAHGRQRIENIIYKGIEEKVWHLNGLSVESAARVIQNLITGQVISWALDPMNGKADDYETLCLAVESILK